LGNKGYKVNRFHFSGIMFPQSRETFFLSATAHVANDHDEFSYCEVTGQPGLVFISQTA
jgi:hypothetical protein